MENGLYSIQEAKVYLGVYEKIVYNALNTGDLQGQKSRGPGGKWLMTKESLDDFKGKIDRGEVDTKFPVTSMKKREGLQSDQKTYTIKEAASLLGVLPHVVYGAKDMGLIPTRKDERGGYVLIDEDIDTVRRSRSGVIEEKSQEESQPVNQQIAPIQPSVVLHSDDKPVALADQGTPTPPRQNDAELLTQVMSSLFSFLANHSLAVGIRSFREVVESFRVWEVQTPDCPVQVIAYGQQVQVVADVYQSQLEDTSQTLKRSLHTAELKLEALSRRRQERTLTEYGVPIQVFIENRVDGVFVWSMAFPFSAYGSTEEEALAFWRRTLFGYTYWLRTHEKDLTSGEKAQFVTLKHALMEE